MKKGFTLIELIFVIVIIGVLSAVAVPKFSKLKQNAEASSVVKVASDAFGAIPSSYINVVDMDGDSNVSLGSLVKITGKGWTLDGNTSTYKDNNNTVVTITLGSDRNASLLIECSQFADSATADKCKSLLGDDNNATQVINF